MKYKCTQKHPQLTVGKEYEEWAPHPCVFNAMVVNDLGDVETFPRKQFFKTISEK